MKLITGIWQDPRGNIAAFGVLHAQLNQDATVIASNQVAPREVSFELNAQGALRPGAAIWANDELSPAGTYYTLAVTAYGGGKIWGPVRLVLEGPGPINITAITPVSTIPPTMPVANTTGAFIGGMFDNLGNSLVVGEQLMLVGGSNISLQGSISGGSITITINCLGATTGSGPMFSFVMNGSTVTNQLVMTGGDNVTLSGMTDANGMTLSIIGAPTAATYPLNLVAGSNVTLSTAMATNGTTVTINAGAGRSVSMAPNTTAVGGLPGIIGSQTNSAGSTFSIAALQRPGNILLSNFADTAFPMTNLSPVRDLLVFAGGSNISLAGNSTFTTFAGGTQSYDLITINGIPPAASSLMITGGNHVTLQSSTALNASSYTINALQFSMVQGSNIVLSSQSNTAGQTVTVNAMAGTGGGDTTIVVSNPPFVAGIGSDTVSNQLMLTAGSNVTLSAASNTSGMTMTLNAGMGIGMISSNNTSGNLGINGRYPAQSLLFNAGSNMILSRGRAGAPGVEDSFTFNAVIPPQGSLSLFDNSRGGMNAVDLNIWKFTDSLGTSYSIPNMKVGMTGTAPGILGGDVMATGYYLLYPGANISISQANDGLLDGAGFYNGGRATIIGNGGFGAGANSAAIGGTFNGSPGQAASLLFLYAGSNIGMSQSLGGPDNMFGSLTINAAGGGGAPAILWQDVNRSETYSNINTIYLGDAVYADGMMNSANQVSGSMVLNAYGFSVNAAGHAGTRALWLYAGSNVSFQTHSDQAGALSLTINAAATAAAMAAGEGVSRLERLEHLIARLSTLI